MNSNILEFYKVCVLRYNLPYLSFFVKQKKISSDYDNYIDSINLLVDDLNFDKDDFHNLLNSYIKSNKETDLTNLNNYLENYYMESKKKVIEIPNDMNKAYDILRALIQIDYFKDKYQVYDAIVLLKDEINEEKIDEIVSYWKNSGHEIWVSYDFMEDIDTVSHYRFKNSFGLDEFDSIFEKEKSEFQARLSENLSSEDINALAFDLWLMDRIPDFMNNNKDLLSFISKFITISWNSKGFWESIVVKTVYKRVIKDEENFIRPKTKFGEKNNILLGTDSNGNKFEKKFEWEPSNYITALLSLILIKYPISDEITKIGILGAKWLSENQNPDGSWSNFDYSKDKNYQDSSRIEFSKGAKFKSDLFITLIAIELILRSDIPSKNRYVKRGWEWIKKQQNELGYWDYELSHHSSFPLLTVLVLELEKLIANDEEKNSSFEYEKKFNIDKINPSFEIAVSFAGENRDIVTEYVKCLKEYGVKVFFDEENEAEMWGKNLMDYLPKIYRESADYCVIFMSKEYWDKIYPQLEFNSAREKYLSLITSEKEYILPVKLDDSEIKGLPSTICQFDFHEKGMDKLVSFTLEKLGKNEYIIKED